MSSCLPFLSFIRCWQHLVSGPVLLCVGVCLQSWGAWGEWAMSSLPTLHAEGSCADPVHHWRRDRQSFDGKNATPTGRDRRPGTCRLLSGQPRLVQQDPLAGTGPLAPTDGACRLLWPSDQGGGTSFSLKVPSASLDIFILVKNSFLPSQRNAAPVTLLTLRILEKVKSSCVSGS